MPGNKALLRLQVELLETRLSPAVHVWTGAGPDNLWSDYHNWSGGVPGSSGTAGMPEQHIQLVFPNGAHQETNTDDIPGLAVDTMEFQGGGYIINPLNSSITITLGGAQATGSPGGGSTITNDAGNNTLAVNLDLEGDTGNPATFAGANAIVAAGSHLTLSGAISGAPTAELFFAGPGTAELAGTSPNTMQGPVLFDAATLLLNKPAGVTAINTRLTYTVDNNPNNVTNGTVQWLADGQFTPTATVDIANGTTLDLNGHADTFAELRIEPAPTAGSSVAGGHVRTGTGLLTLTDGIGKSATPDTSLSTISGHLALPNPGELFDIASSAPSGPDLLIDAGINGTGGFTKTGTGILQLSGSSANTYAGNTTVNGGELDLGKTAAVTAVPGPIAVNNSGSVLRLLNGNQQLNPAQPVTLSGGSLFDLNGFSQTVGPLNLNSSTVSDTSGPLVLTGGVAVTGTSSITGGGQITLPSPQTFTVGAVGDSLTIAPTMSGPGGLTKAGAGLLELTAANTYTEPTTVSSGTLANGVANALPTATALTVGGVYDLNGFNQQLSSIAGPGTIIDSQSPATLAVNNTSADEFDGSLSGSLALIKSGGGTLLLTGTSPYTGATTVAGGTLDVTGKQPASPIHVLGNAALGGTGTVGPTTVDAGGTLSPGVGGPGALTVHGSLMLSPGSNYNVQLNGTAAGSGYSQVRADGAVSVNGSMLNFFFGFTPPSGTGDTPFVLISGPGPVNGNFAGFTDGIVFGKQSTCFQLTYNESGNQNVLLTDLGDNHLFVLGLYRDLVGNPNPSDRATVRALSTVDRAVAVNFVWNTPEHRARIVQSIFDAFGIQDRSTAGTYEALLRTESPALVLLTFLTSPQFTALHPGNRSFIQAVFLAATGRRPTPREATQLVAFLDRHVHSRFEVAAHILSLSETLAAAARDNAAAFGLTPSGAEVQALVAGLQNGTISTPQGLTAAVIAGGGRDAAFLNNLKAVCGREQWALVPVKA
jgi:autotransporter-associated beta strand protein